MASDEDDDFDLYDDATDWLRTLAEIRDEEDFPSVEELVVQMKKDEAEARLALSDAKT